MSYQSLIFMSMRGVAVLAKVIFSILIMKTLSLSQFGEYSLSLIIINTLVISIGLDIYYFTHSQILDGNRYQDGKDLVVQHLGTALIISLIFALIAIIFDLVGVNYLGSVSLFLIVIIAVIEYLLQEVYRYFILYDRPWAANLSLFFRTSIWPIMILILVHFSLVKLTAITILLIWLIVNALMFFVTLYIIRTYISGGYFNFFNVDEFKTVIKFSMPWFISSILFKFCEYFDRFFLSIHADLEVVGAYSYLFSISNIIQTFVFAGVLSLKYSSYVKKVRSSNFSTYNLIVFLRDVLVVSVMLGIFSVLIFENVNGFLNKETMNKYNFELLMIIVGTIFILLSTVAHYHLFSLKKNRIILISHTLTFLLTSVLSVILIPAFGLSGAAVSMLISSIFLFSIKISFVLREEVSR